MSFSDQRAIQSFLKEMALQMTKEFSSRQLDIIWGDFKLNSKPSTRVYHHHPKQSTDLQFENEVEKVMMINYHPNQVYSKKNKQNEVKNTSRIFGKHVKKIESASSKDKSNLLNINQNQKAFDKPGKIKIKQIPQSISNEDLNTYRSLPHSEWKDQINYYKQSFQQFMNQRSWQRKKNKIDTKRNQTDRVARNTKEVKDPSVPKLILSRLGSKQQNRESPLSSAVQTSQTFRSRIR